MITINFFRIIGAFFTNVLFVPFNSLRFNNTWWSSNIMSIILISIGFLALIYWLSQMVKFKKEGE